MAYTIARIWNDKLYDSKCTREILRAYCYLDQFFIGPLPLGEKGSYDFTTVSKSVSQSVSQ